MDVTRGDSFENDLFDKEERDWPRTALTLGLSSRQKGFLSHVGSAEANPRDTRRSPIVDFPGRSVDVDPRDRPGDHQALREISSSAPPSAIWNRQTQARPPRLHAQVDPGPTPTHSQSSRGGQFSGRCLLGVLRRHSTDPLSTRWRRRASDAGPESVEVCRNAR